MTGPSPRGRGNLRVARNPPGIRGNEGDFLRNSFFAPHKEPLKRLERTPGVRLGRTVFYSIRNASVGFTADARCAGMNVAASPAEQSTRIAIAITAGSEGFTS